MENVAQKLTDRLERKGLSLQEVSLALGRSKSYLHDVKRGRQKLNYDAAVKLAQILDISIRELGFEPVVEEVPDRQLIFDASPYVPPRGHWLSTTAKLKYARMVRDSLNQHPKMVRKGDLIGFVPGKVALDGLEIGTLVVLALTHPRDGESPVDDFLVREFVPPNKLITNSSGRNEILRLDDHFPYVVTIVGQVLTIIREDTPSSE